MTERNTSRAKAENTHNKSASATEGGDGKSESETVTDDNKQETSNQNQQNPNNTQEDTMNAQNTKKTSNTAGNQFETFANEAANAQQQGAQAFQQCQASFMRGVEDMMKTCTSILQETGEKSAQNVKTLLNCKTLDEFSQVQNKLWQENFDLLMSNTTKLSETSIRVASQCMEPINEQFTTAVQRAGDSLAA